MRQESKVANNFQLEKKDGHLLYNMQDFRPFGEVRPTLLYNSQDFCSFSVLRTQIVV